MQKIPTLFERDPKTLLVIDKVKPECQWVIDDEGIPTEKIDGTCCMIKDGELYKYYELNLAKTPLEKAQERGFIIADPTITKKNTLLGWMPVTDSPEDRYHREGFNWLYWLKTKHDDSDIEDGTYELVGPKVQNNYYNLETHMLFKHGWELGGWFVCDLDVFCNPPLTFKCLRLLFQDFVEHTEYFEGLVWHHPDGRMAKLKAKDFFGNKCQDHKKKKEELDEEEE